MVAYAGELAQSTTQGGEYTPMIRRGVLVYKPLLRSPDRPQNWSGMSDLSLFKRVAERLQAGFASLPSRYGGFRAVTMPVRDSGIATDTAAAMLTLWQNQMAYFTSSATILYPKDRPIPPMPIDLMEASSKLLLLLDEAGKSLLPSGPKWGALESDRERWILKLFEIGWKKVPGTSLVAKKFVCLAIPGFTVALEAWPAFKEASTSGSGMTASEGLLKIINSLPPENPPWYSVIEDVAAASVSAIDVLLHEAKQPTPERTKIRPSEDPVDVRSEWSNRRYVANDGSDFKIWLPLIEISPDGSPHDTNIDRDELSDMKHHWGGIQRTDEFDEFLFFDGGNGKSRWLKVLQAKLSDGTIGPSGYDEPVEKESRVIELTKDQATQWFAKQGLDRPDELKPKRRTRKSRRKLKRKSDLTISKRAIEAKFDGKPLDINAHADFKVLAALFDAKGAAVPYVDLLRAVKPNEISKHVHSEKEAPQEVKDAVNHIRKALKSARCPRKIKTIRGVGYRLLSHDE